MPKELEYEARIAANRKAVEAEYNLRLGKAKDLAVEANEILRNNLPAAAERIVFLMQHGEKSSDQLKAAMWIYEQFTTGEESPLSRLIDELTPSANEAAKV